MLICCVIQNNQDGKLVDMLNITNETARNQISEDGDDVVLIVL